MSIFGRVRLDIKRERIDIEAKQTSVQEAKLARR
jgi:hypothetical protein